MPNRDGTGPQGKGPMTGKGIGSCKRDDKSGKNLPFESGKGQRCGRGMKRGCGNRWNSIEESKENTNIKEG